MTSALRGRALKKQISVAEFDVKQDERQYEKCVDVMFGISLPLYSFFGTMEGRNNVGGGC